MKSNKIGEIGENLALKHLKRCGYRVVERNFSTRFGEIDLIVNKKGVLIFVEVKTRMGRGRPEWSITGEKINQVKQMAEAYLIKKEPKYKNLRLDALCIDLNYQLEVEDIRHYQNLTLNL